MQQAISADSIPASTPDVGSDYVPIQSLVGMSAYDGEAMLIGKVEEIGLKRSGGSARITIKVGEKEVPWDGISKIGDIVLLKTSTSSGGKCPSCGFQNDADSAFCSECGSKF
jgi:sporulation protein YlmC with PRC-barrel domain